MKHIIISLCVLFFTAACSKEDIPTYDATNYVQFMSDYTDSLEISFFFYPGQDQLEIPLDFKLLGQLLPEEADFTIDIVKEATTAAEQYYDLPENPRFAKESVYDRKTLILHNPGEHTFRLVLEVKGGSRLLAGQLEYTRKVIWFSNEVIRPQWWDQSVEDSFLGPYTKTKFETLVKVTKVGDWTNLSPDQRLAQARKLKYYLREMETAGTPVKDENNQNMTVPVMG